MASSSIRAKDVLGRVYEQIGHMPTPGRYAGDEALEDEPSPSRGE